MTGSTAATSSPAPPPPKILLAKHGSVTSGTAAAIFGRGEDETASFRSRIPPIASLNLLSDSWDFHVDRFLPYLTENTDFRVVGVIGLPGVGKSTIMNEFYGFDGSSSGMLPPFAVQSDDSRAMARHCTTGIEPRVSAERIILLDTQPVFSPSVLAEMMKVDGSSTIPVLGGESFSPELAHELISIQLGVFLASICHAVLVVSDGVHDDSMWQLMLTVDLLKHAIPDPSFQFSSHSQSGSIVPGKENKDKVREAEEYMATVIFVHTKVGDSEHTPDSVLQLKKALGRYFNCSSFGRRKCGNKGKDDGCYSSQTGNLEKEAPKLYLISSKKKDDDSPGYEYDSYVAMLWKLRDQVLSMKWASFARGVSEREWLKNSAKIWEAVRSSAVIAEYGRTLESCSIYRR